jgi:hypothetical protein
MNLITAIFLFVMQSTLLDTNVFVKCVIQYAPTWITNTYIRAGNMNLFTTLTGQGVLNTYVFSFSSNLSGVPMLGYGVKSYAGIILFYIKQMII